MLSAAAASVEHMYEGIQITWRQLIQVMREHGFEMREDFGHPSTGGGRRLVAVEQEGARVAKGD